jgi:hypothetical protein
MGLPELGFVNFQQITRSLVMGHELAVQFYDSIYTSILPYIFMVYCLIN